MTIRQYQESELSPQLAEMLREPAFRAALEVAQEASPANGGMREWKDPHHAHIQLGIDRGYNLYPQILKLLATQPKKQEEVPATYAAPPEEEGQE